MDGPDSQADFSHLHVQRSMDATKDADIFTRVLFFCILFIKYLSGLKLAKRTKTFVETSKKLLSGQSNLYKEPLFQYTFHTLLFHKRVICKFNELYNSSFIFGFAGKRSLSKCGQRQLMLQKVDLSSGCSRDEAANEC